MSFSDDLLFQFDVGSTNSVDALRQTGVSPQRRSRTLGVPRTFVQESPRFDEYEDEDESEDDEATIYSRSTATTLIDQTPLMTADVQRSRHFRTAVGTSLNAFDSSYGSTASRNAGEIEPDEYTVQPKMSVRDKSTLNNISTSTRNNSTTPPYSNLTITDDAKRHSLNEHAISTCRNDMDLPHQKSNGLIEESRRRRLEQLTDVFWLKDGTIEEDIFEDSSDEEDSI